MTQGDYSHHLRGAARAERSRRPAAWLGSFVAVAVLACGDDPPILPPAGFGDIYVSLTSTGGDIDLDGYVVTLDGVAVGSVASDGAVKLAGIPSGARVIGLEGVAANCQVEGTNPRPVPVLPARVASVSFRVGCLTTGIAVIVEQTGADLDADGFTVIVDGRAGEPVAPFQPHVVSRLEPGTHTVSIGGLADNCSVSDGEAITTTVAVGAITPVRFVVTCEPVTGTIEVTAVTSGEDLDPDGYQVRVDGGAARLLLPNGTAVIQGVAPGDRTINLDGNTRNCHVVGAGARQASVTPGVVTKVLFELTCARTDVIAFTDGTGADAKIHLMHADDGATRFLVEGSDPDWSPDGRRIVYRRFTCAYGSAYGWGFYCRVIGLFVTRTDTVAPSLLTDFDDGAPDWSPDGTKIAFTRWTGTQVRIHVMNADGTGVREIPIPGFNDAAHEVVWSPDGSRFAFQCQGPGYVDTCVVNVDGSGFRRLLEDAAFDGHPAWRPDGQEIAFTTVGTRIGTYRVALIRPDGTGFREIADGEQASWSADGTRIVLRGKASETAVGSLFLINADGSGQVRLTLSANHHAPAWRP